jgi:hypothetical protein
MVLDQRFKFVTLVDDYIKKFAIPCELGLSELDGFIDFFQEGCRISRDRV